MGGLIVSLLAGPGSDDDWGEVVDLYEPTLRRVIVRRTADRNLVDDVLQETYARAWRARLSGAQRGIPDARWMSLLATRVSVDVFRRQPPPDNVDPAALVGEWLTADRAVLPGSDEHVDALVSRQALRWAFRRLTVRQRRLLVLRGVRNLSYREIAEREGISESAVASALNRARERLRANLADYAEGRTGKLAPAVLALGFVERVRTRLSRVQSTVGAHAFELAWTTAALGVAMVVASPPPSVSTDLRSAAAEQFGEGDVMAIGRLSVSPDTRAEGMASPTTALSPVDGRRPGEAPANPSAPGPLRTATNLDVGAEEMTFRLDVAIDIPGIDDRGSLVVEVYCTRNALVSPGCPILDAHEPGDEAITSTRQH